jgi:hypothetical protein
MPRRERDFHRSDDADIWSRIVKRRRQECATLETSVLQEMVKDVEGTNTSLSSPYDQFEHILNHHFELATDPSMAPEKRRAAWSTVASLLSKADAQVGRRKQAEEPNSTAATASAAILALSRVDLSATAFNSAATNGSTASATANGSTVSTTAARSNNNCSSAPSAFSSTQNGHADRQVSTDSRKEETSRASITASLAAASASTVALSASAVSTVPTVHPALAKNPATHPPVNGLAPPPYQRTSAIAAIRLAEKNATKKTTSVSNKNSSSNLPVHPSLQGRSLPTQSESSRTYAAAAQQPSRTSSDGAPRHTEINQQRSTSWPEVPVNDTSKRKQAPSAPATSAAATSSTRTSAFASTTNATASLERRNSDEMDISDDENQAPRGSQAAPPSKKSEPAPNKTTAVPAVNKLAPASNRMTVAPAANKPAPASNRITAAPAANKPAPASNRTSATANQLKPIDPPPPQKPTVAKIVTEIVFGTDPGKSDFTGAYNERQPVKAFFRKQHPTGDMSNDMGRRFAMWEPYWKLSHQMASIGLTVPIDRVVWKHNPGAAPPETIKTASSFILKGLKEPLFQKIRWGKDPVAPRNGEYRLILRMLPVKIDTKKKRADCHLWPKGTYLTLNGKLQRLHQRKQPSHDLNLWNGMCKYLDMGSIITNPGGTNRIDICCYDSEQYIYCLIICKYQAAGTLTEDLLKRDNYHLQRLSLKESEEKAMQLIKQQMIVLDDDVDDDSGTDLGNFVFSLVCPMSKLPMTNPVRGTKCKHWQVRRIFSMGALIL